MRACIHRGAKEIGGSCVELEHDGDRLLLDLGLPLDAPLDGTAAMPAIDGLTEGDPTIRGLVVTHGHPDHYGLVPQVSCVPVYIGEATQRTLAEAAFFSPAGATIEAAGWLRDREPLDVGSFKVVPRLVDHSAFDAYALLVEADGRRLFYSGDLRAHGRNPQLFTTLLENPPGDIDVLLLEGTHIRDSGKPDVHPGRTEDEVEDGLVEAFTRTPGMALVSYSPQNVDRLVSLRQAARRAGRQPILDLYAATIAITTGCFDDPRVGWDGVRVFLPHSQRVRVLRAGSFERVERVRALRVFAEELAADPSRFVMTFRASMTRELERAACLDGASAVWSLWPGYLADDNGRRLENWLRAHSIPLSVIHASGHARVADLQRLARALRPTHITPIHTAAPWLFPTLFGTEWSDVKVRDNGEWFDV